MSSRSPARWLAPLALLVAIAAVGYVVSSATRDDEETGPSSGQREETSRQRTQTDGKTSTGSRTTTASSSEPRNYTVKAGDTLGMIAEQTGVPVERLQELNPDLDPQSLTVGERIRLRR